ncbi:class I SAM-dependent methyltransferase, partial [Rhodopseudomonas pseudopalustris]
MAHDDPFTLDLFGNSAIAPGLGLGVTAFAPDPAADGKDDEPPPAMPA